MRHKVTRLILGTMLIVVSIIQVVRGTYLQSGLFLAVGVAFLYSGIKISKNGKQ